ncbi:RND transporter MFP subunit [Azorhizobium oxalatiphilum]|uniref:RND transporter MFP subunit n=1 Tax=Azorhizobium oxalatiphilum TaxID=980631 RepID=A0A917C440_9HYPH|nr:efflux RND transporter periplasmic adaptor subunit [Azorhizobium oxalatiphilum]GGF69816.1 RND transporter MFP subunit [Azorhizobium oxalatiphilum]
MRSFPYMRMAIMAGATLLFTGSAVFAQGQAIPVTVAPAELRPITPSLEFVGRIEAPEKVEIRARVKGMLEAVLFRDGETVSAGAPLYRIEKPLFSAAVQQAEGDLERSKAALTLAKIQRERAEELLTRNAGTVVARDQAIAAEAQSTGAVLSGEADVQTAQINLGYTDITAPISGRIGRSTVTKGHIVGPESGVLTVIVSQDPMYVTFPVSQRDYLQAQKDGRTADLKSLDVKVKFSDGTTYGEVGRISFVDVSVDRTTDTLVLRADIPNPKAILTDGQLVRVNLQTAKPEERILIPQAALIADQEGLYVFVVEGGKAAVRRIKTAGAQGNFVVVASGLNPGDQVVVDGFQSLKPGVAVQARPQASGLANGG